MSTTRLVRYLTSFFDAGEIKYAAGEHYPRTEETERHVTAGIAIEIDVDLSAEKAAKLAEKARLAADRAAAAAAQAQELSEAAHAAQLLADEAAAAEAARIAADEAAAKLISTGGYAASDSPSAPIDNATGSETVVVDTVAAPVADAAVAEASTDPA